MTNYLLIQLLTEILTALFISLVVLKTQEMSLWNRVLLVEWIALAVFAAGTVPEWNWYAFSNAYAAAELFDTIVGFFFAGLVISRIIGGKGVKPQV